MIGSKKFFYIRRGVIPIDMHYRSESEGVPRVNVSISYTEQDWYTTLTRKVTPIIQLEERALVAAGMSMLWAPQNPRVFQFMDIKGKASVAEQVEARRKKKKEKTEGKKAEEPVTETPRKRPSNSSFLDYVFVSNTVSGLDAGVKPQSCDPDDDATRYDLFLCVYFESEIDLGVFSKKTGNHLEKIFKSSFAPRASSKFARSRPKIDISKITPPASLPSKPLDLSPPHPDPKGKGKGDDVEVERTERVVENIVAGSGRDEVHAEGAETEYESSVATPQGTVYTKRVHGSGGGGASGSQQGPEFHRVQGGSWTTHNPACDDLPHAPHWTLTQGNGRRWGRTQWSLKLLIGSFAAEREAFNAEKKGLLWRVADNEEKLAKEKQFNADRQKEWEAACERTNRELKAARDEIVRLKGEKTKQSDEHERAIAVYQKRENKYEHRLANLEKVVAEKTAESKALEILAEEIMADCKWLLARGVPLTAFDSGRKEGYGEGRAAAVANEKVDHFELFKVDCSAHYAAKRQEYEFLKFAVVRAVEKLSRKGSAVETLKKALGDQDAEAEDAGPIHQV
ncbi:hypothetical protein HanHA300_Chr14g0515301 [Helianthus annuus]|nr:hypothetical protein HanHA300_Chr14g0515301 [Helianthus annuus]